MNSYTVADPDFTFHEILILIKSLPEKYQFVFNLYEIEGYSHQEISKMMGIAESSSRTFLARAKEQLRSMIKKNYPLNYEKAIGY